MACWVPCRWLRLVMLAIVVSVQVRGQTGASSSPSSDSTSKDHSSAQSASTQKADAVHSALGYELQPGEDPQNRLVSPFVRHIVADQKEFWTSPARFRTKDLKWILPGAGIAAAFIASDSWWAKQVNPTHMQTSLHISDYGTYSLIGLGGASFLFGHMTNNDHLQETGLLSGEAAINATGVAYLFKEITQRQRPLQDNANGDFFKGGSSFPSEHSAIAWSIASVWAHEYPGWLSQIAAYGLASAITVTRVTAQQHFPIRRRRRQRARLVLRPASLSCPPRSGSRGSTVGESAVGEYRGESSQSSLHGFALRAVRQLDSSLAGATHSVGLHAIEHARDTSLDPHGVRKNAGRGRR